MRIERATLAAAVSLVCSTGTLGAQAIRGVVVDGADRPVAGVVVFMLDSTSAVVARALSSERGEFRVAATRAGTYRLRTMRIGYRPATTETAVLLLGGEIEKRVTLTGAQVALDTVRIVDRNSCRVESDASAAATFAVLEQARTALSAAQLTMSGRNISATTIAYNRRLEPDGRHVLEQSSRTTTAYVTQPWRAISPDSSHRAGFVHYGDDGSTTFFAPSIDVLLSNAFVEDHCFRLVSDRKQPEVVGVAFEPSGDRSKLAEIKGTLWVNKKTAELQRLDYRYVNITRAQQDAGAGGDASFARLKNGGWAIADWNIRMPVLEQVMRAQALGGSTVRLAALQVSGGAIQFATRTVAGMVDTLWSRPGLVLSGVVVDSARGTPIANAKVDLVGATLTGTTDARGRFSIPNVLPGTYSVETSTPELAALGAANQSTLAFSDTTASYQIRVPSAAQLVAGLCSSRALGNSEGVIVGRVYQRGDTVPEADARVVAEWTVVALRDEHGVVVDRNGRKLEGRTTRDGSYRLCGAPLSTSVTVTAASDAASSDPKTLYSATRVTRADLVVDHAISLTATFAGRVLDSAKAPIDGAEIFFPELSKVGRTVTTGSFRVAEIAPGPQHVIVRRVGYGALDTTLAFTANKELDRDIVLTRANVLDSVVVTDRMTLNILRDFEDNRRVGLGHFLDRAELAKMTPDVHVGKIAAQWPGVQLAFGSGGRMWITGTRKGPPPCTRPTKECYESHGYYFPDKTGASVGEKIACYSQVYINGVLMNHGNPTPPFEANTLFADQLEAVEWYAGPSETPGRYSNLNAVCGVLVIYTRRTP